MFSPRPRLLLIDSLSIFFLYHFGIKHRAHTVLIHGEPLIPSGIFGFTRFLLKAVTTLQAQHVIVTGESNSADGLNSFSNVIKNVDPSFVSHRHLLYPLYKANRVSLLPEVINSIKYVPKITKAFGLPHVSAAGFEGDDVLASLAVRFQKDYDVWIISFDKDLCQLVCSSVRIYEMASGVFRDEAYVNRTYGVAPSQMCDLFSLIGDAADNIPGVRGIGPHYGKSLINKFGSVEELYQKLETSEVKKSIKNLLIKGKQNAFLSKKLFACVKDIPLLFDEILNKSKISREFSASDELVEHLRLLKFNQIAQELNIKL